ncbi:interferon a3-like [Parambassis ranga]|uniref:Interferon a3-like n=1 Tax=Parambassis ranga TaxID=210632 RepID=A0A6P7IJ43_9TELE|nr:interferon a3-like [Parambassis ranga]
MPSRTSLLFVLCSVLNSALGCKWLSDGRLRNESITLIEAMGGPMTKEGSPVSFPYRFYDRIENSQAEKQLVFIRDSMKLIFRLYHHNNYSSAAWDTVRTEHFLMSIDKQIEELNHCVSTNIRTDRRLRRYYRKLATSTLHHTGGSAASWELIRKETQQHLFHLDLLVATIRRRSATTKQQQ